MTSLAFAFATLLVEGVRQLEYSTRFQILGRLVDRVSTDTRTVALTYDDGPNPPFTEQILDRLKRHQARATFFVIGREAELHPDTLRRINEQGHELGNHSYSHFAMSFKAPGLVRSEIERTDAVIVQAGGAAPILFRAPYGRKFLILPYILSAMDKTNVLWDVIPEPPDYRAKSAADLARDVLFKIRPGSIVLLHDGGGDRSITVEATDLILATLRRDGYTLVTVSELLASVAKP